MVEMWSRFGFHANPYITAPLEPNEADAKMFVGRAAESGKFVTAIDNAHGCVVIVSGDVGIGKTSFLNVQQYRIANDRAVGAPRLLPSYQHVTIQRSDIGDEVGLALKVAHRAIQSVRTWCSTNNLSLPRQVKAIEGWISHRAAGSGFSIGLSILGFGGNIARSVSLPSVSETTLEGWQDVLSVIASECAKSLGVEGLILCLDNSETLSVPELSEVLMSFRDTVFSTKGLWWVVIGTSSLVDLLGAYDTRVFERIRKPGIEIPPMSDTELFDMVEERIKRFRTDEQSRSPLSKAIHDRLFLASRGVARFALDTADALFNEIVAAVRTTVEEVSSNMASKEALGQALDEALARILFEDEEGIPDRVAEASLAGMAVRAVIGGGVSVGDLDIMVAIGPGEVAEDELNSLGLDALGEAVEALIKKKHVQRLESNGRRTIRLRNYASLCLQLDGFGRLRELVSTSS